MDDDIAARRDAAEAARADLGDGFRGPAPDIDPPNTVALTPNGRYVRRQPDGRLTVQPHNDNYLLTVDTLDAAKGAYFRPQDFR
jgi:hypothetical protein